MKSVLITGGGSGIGRATALAFAADGWSVAVAGRTAANVRAVTAEIQASGGNALSLVADVTDPFDVERMVETTMQRCGGLDVVVNNAGMVATGPLAEFSIDAWDNLMAVNLRGVFLVCRAVLPHMLERRAGHIINIASVAAKVGFPQWAAYCASKAGVAGLSRALLEEVRGAGIRVSVLYPGSTNTPLWDSFPNDFKRDRMLADSDVARAVLWTAAQPEGVLIDELSMGFPLGNQ